MPKRAPPMTLPQKAAIIKASRNDGVALAYKGTVDALVRLGRAERIGPCKFKLTDAGWRFARHGV